MLESRIRESRLRRGWNQAELAQQMHVAQPTVSAWETGLKAPRLKILLRLSAVLGVNFQWLSTGEGEPGFGPAGLVGGRAADSGHIAGSYDLLDQDEEDRLLNCYMQLNLMQRQALLALLEAFQAGSIRRREHPQASKAAYSQVDVPVRGTGPGSDES